MSVPSAPTMTETTDQAKASMRKAIRRILSGMSEEARHEASVRACQRLIALPEFQHASIVMLYMPMVREVDLTPTAIQCFRHSKTVCVPRVDRERVEITPVEVGTFDDHVMDTDEYGIRVPREGRPMPPAMIDLAVVPGLAFDAEGRRLGRGGGYYDRFLTRLRPGAVKVGLAFDQQMVDRVPSEANDVAVDIVVTDRRVTSADSARTRR